jgi:membrane-associated phospholipid phosphatase
MAIMFTSFILAAIITFLSICFYDKLLAIYISNSLVKHSIWHKYTNDIPDFLFLTVCITTAFAYIIYRTRIRKGIYNKDTIFFQIIMYAVPATYAFKSFLKYVFGRTTTREWLLKPELYGFHWFQGGGLNAGFPSGHMAVFSAMTASLWRFYPRYRVFYAIFLLILAVALIATNYHFLSDVIAGAYLGVFVEACTYKVVTKASR